jgi:hypothetical protein
VTQLHRLGVKKTAIQLLPIDYLDIIAGKNRRGALRLRAPLGVLLSIVLLGHLPRPVYTL